MDNSILIIDDERIFLETVKRGLAASGFRNVHLESDPKRAAALFGGRDPFDVALIDINMPGTGGIELLKLIKQTCPGTECLMVTATNEARVAVDCLKNGACDYLVKPISREGLISAVRAALGRKPLFNGQDSGKKERLPKLVHAEAFEPILTRSEKVLRILREAELHAASDVPVLISGESGTGKELLAKAIHRASSRAKFPFTPINMASLTGSLFESEFFGHTKGAFTGAQKDRMGYIEHAFPR
jgi:two-component system response regulator AtoC